MEVTGPGVVWLLGGVESWGLASNSHVWRVDTWAIRKWVRSGFWRLRGSNFLSNWDWHGAIGPRDKRAPMYDHDWSGMQANDFGMDEWMTLTRLIGVEPYVTVDAGLGEIGRAHV